MEFDNNKSMLKLRTKLTSYQGGLAKGQVVIKVMQEDNETLKDQLRDAETMAKYFLATKKRLYISLDQDRIS